MQAAEWFAEGVEPPEVARRLRVSSNSAYVWRRRWRAGGEAALASKGPGGAVCRLSARQLERLRAALEGGPAAWGWSEDQRWTLARVTALIGRLFHVRYTLRGTSYLLHRLGYSPQVPVHRAVERDEDAIAAWRAGDLGEGTRLAAATGRVDLLRGRGRAEPAPAEGPDLGPPRPHPRGQGVRQGLRAGVSGRPGVPQARAAGAACSTGSASTAGARASAARCPKPTTPA